MMKRILELWKTLPRPHQAAIVAVVLLIVMLVSGGVGGFVSHWKDKRFERRQAEYQKQIDALTIERTAAIAKAEVFEKQAKDLEAKVKINEVIIAAAGSRAEAAQKELVKEDEKYQKEIESVDNPIDSCERIKRICERAKALKLYPSNKICQCE